MRYRQIAAVSYGGTAMGKMTRRTPVALLETERHFGERTGTYFVWADLFSGRERHRIGEVEYRPGEGWSARSGDRYDADDPKEWLGCFESRERALYALIPRWVRLPPKAHHLEVLKQNT